MPRPLSLQPRPKAFLPSPTAPCDRGAHREGCNAPAAVRRLDRSDPAFNDRRFPLSRVPSCPEHRLCSLRTSTAQSSLNSRRGLESSPPITTSRWGNFSCRRVRPRLTVSMRRSASRREMLVTQNEQGRRAHSRQASRATTSTSTKSGCVKDHYTSLLRQWNGTYVPRKSHVSPGFPIDFLRSIRI
jgi:hypothetical protein